MEIKAILEKPYTEEEKENFIVKQNHNLGYEIKENDNALEAWGNTYEELIKKEKELLAKLKLTKREVFLGIFQAKGVTPEQIKAKITDPLDLIEFEYANEYFRGNPLIDSVGQALGFTSEELDNFFRYKSFTIGGDMNV